jgi:hypothetical protein
MIKEVKYRTVVWVKKLDQYTSTFCIYPKLTWKVRASSYPGDTEKFRSPDTAVLYILQVIFRSNILISLNNWLCCN